MVRFVPQRVQMIVEQVVEVSERVRQEAHAAHSVPRISIQDRLVSTPKVLEGRGEAGAIALPVYEMANRQQPYANIGHRRPAYEPVLVGVTSVTGVLAEIRWSGGKS